MKKCKLCGKKGLFLRLNSEGYCPKCEKFKEREAERQRQELRRAEEAWTKISRIPEYEIRRSDVPRKRRRGYEKIPFSNITPKGVYDDVVVIDTETTGLAPSRDRIVELAGVKYADGRPVEVFRSFVNPEREIPEEARKINGITDEMVADAPVIGEILPSFEDFLGASTLVGHNLEFDLRFLFYSGSVVTDTKRRYIDTLRQAQRFLKKPKWGAEDGEDEEDEDYDVEDYRLDTLCDYYRIKIAKKHDALADAYATGELFFRLVDERR